MSPYLWDLTQVFMLTANTPPSLHPTIQLKVNTRQMCQKSGLNGLYTSKIRFIKKSEEKCAPKVIYNIILLLKQ